MPSPPLPHRVKGWCPGALRPMATGDGLLVRLRISGGRLSADRLAAVAALARRHGNGLVDQSQRANLQLRGVTERTWPDLIAALNDLGLLDADAEAEAIRNIVPSPLAGCDPTAPVDGTAIAADLERRLGADEALKALPGKFGFLVDEGGLFPLDGTATDIRLTGRTGGRVLIALAGTASTAVSATTVPEAQAGATAVALAQAYLALRQPEERRLAALLARIGAPALVRAAGLTPIEAPASVPSPQRGAAPAVGFHPWPSSDGRGFLHLAAPFGRWDADQLDALADLARRFGDGDIRLTPGRAVVLSGIATAARAAALAAAAGAGIVTTPQDARLAVVACAGRPDCSSGLQPARTDAARFAAAAVRLPGSGVRLHVSGCPKGCAQPGPAALTLVGREAGYDLVLDGAADQSPQESALSAEDVLARLAALADKGRP
ncbi:hypothetical protein ABB55_10620 [Prosthecomicrobium hirschii]|uniref:Nitrite/Sulfite reductase ferredoxin-like domain-containing protein n=1 Tax=Prosthecodimorpha hirschii TaxID=665126 RepID=A0A0P6VJH5_9HYPH|nr:precorrin-3B synthase [Prosthecomicrobium hirschii]KPL52620.1 hypothetical protein ABB55_10620 [Prosthecomicrobium hirschii]